MENQHPHRLTDSPTPTAAPPSPARRWFLRWASGLGAGLMALLIGVPSVAAFLTPGFGKPRKKAWVKIADDVSTLDVGTPVKIDYVEAVHDAWVEGRTLRTVWLYTDDGAKFTAYSGVCTHLGCSFRFDREAEETHREKNVFHCPCHHGIFDLKTGAVIGGPPPRPLDTLPVEIRNGEVWIQYQTFRTGVPQKIEA